MTPHGYEQTHVTPHSYEQTHVTPHGYEQARVTPHGYEQARVTPRGYKQNAKLSCLLTLMKLEGTSGNRMRRMFVPYRQELTGGRKKNHTTKGFIICSLKH